MQTTLPGLYAAGDCTGGLLKWPRPFMKGRWPARKPPRPCGKDNIMSEVQPSAVNRNCLACAFPFWGQLTPCRAGAALPLHPAREIPERGAGPTAGGKLRGLLLLRPGQLRAYFRPRTAAISRSTACFRAKSCILSASCVMDSVNFDLYIDAEGGHRRPTASARASSRQLMQQKYYVRCYAYQMTATRTLFRHHVDDAAESLLP